MSNSEERREKINRLVREYPIKLGLGVIQPTNEVEKYLNLTQPELRRMSPEDCGEAGYIVAKSMTYIQLELNKVQADINWCEEYIKWIISKTIASVGSQYTPFEYKKILAIQQDDVATQLQKIIVIAKAEVDSMNFIASHLKTVINTLENLQYTKRNQKS